MARRAAFTNAEIAALCKLAGVEPPKAAPKYRSVWTYWNGRIFHSKGRDCPPAPRCPICDDPLIKADREHWYQSRNEASFVAKCDLDVKLGLIRAHRRSPTLVLVPGTRAERVTYRPDRDVWVSADPDGPPDRRYEVKGAREMISQQGKVRIRLYRAAVRRGEQPPLHVVRGDGAEIEV